MASSISSFSILNHAFCRHKLFYYPKIRFQNLWDNGKPANMVDANLNVLRERIEKVRKRERLNIHHTSGWNYKQKYEGKYKRDLMVSESIEIMGLAFGAIGLVLLIGSLSLGLLSLLVYFC